MGEFDFKSYENFAKDFQSKLKQQSAEALLMDVMKDIEIIGLRNVKANTPVGQYNDQWVRFVTGEGELVEFWARSHGKQGGTLRDGWKATNVVLGNNSVVVTLYNDVEYAEWVEKGHATVNGGWVEGQFFLKMTMEELHEILEKVAKPKYDAYLKDLFSEWG